MKNNKNIAVLLLSVFALSTFSPAPRTVNAQNEGFTATELYSSKKIVVDGEKDSVWDVSTGIAIDKVRKQNLFDGSKSNPNPATGTLNVMFNESKLSGIGKLQFSGGSQTAIGGEEFAGVSLMYSAVHGEDDKINAPNVASNADLVENFNKLFNPHLVEDEKEDE
jgi:hypothetical protein